MTGVCVRRRQRLLYLDETFVNFRRKSRAKSAKKKKKKKKI
jgi:hypothetical protein